MRKDWKLIPKILSGQKTIESRWYKTKRTPWDKIKPGDTIFFKNSGEPITAQAKIAKVLQFTCSTVSDIKRIIKRYGKQICLVNSDPATWNKLPRYCILLFLHHTKPTKPLQINKSGFGMATAWITVPDIKPLQI